MLRPVIVSCILAAAAGINDRVEQHLHKLEAPEVPESRGQVAAGSTLPIQRVNATSTHVAGVPLVFPDTILVAFPNLASYATTPEEHAAVANAVAHPVIIGYSARAASTVAFEAYAQHVGMLYKAMMPDGTGFTGWVHLWRGADRSAMEAGTILPRRAAGTAEAIPSVKITMNPYRRAVASYWHQIYYDFGNIKGDTKNQLIAGESPQDMERNYNRIERMHQQLHIQGPDGRFSVSFIGWLQAVKAVGFEVLDVHSRPQRTDEEQRGQFIFNKICHLEGDLTGCLHQFGIAPPPANLCETAPYAAQSDTCEHEIRKVDDARIGIAAMEYRALTGPTGGTYGIGHFPKPSDFYHGEAGQEAMALVGQLYAIDFRDYGYHVGDVSPSTIDG